MRPGDVVQMRRCEVVTPNARVGFTAQAKGGSLVFVFLGEDAPGAPLDLQEVLGDMAAAIMAGEATDPTDGEAEP